MKWLTPGGLVAACAVGAGVTRGLGLPGLALLFAFFLTGSVLTQLAERRGPSRNARQVLANGGVALLAALLGSWAGAAGAIAAAAADTWATEIGAYSPFPPRLITSGRRVTRGTSGGITALGTLGGVAGAALIGGLTRGLSPRGMAPGFATLAAECPACDARFERGNTVCHEPVRLARGWRWLDNDGVNFAATLVGAAAAVLATPS